MASPPNPSTREYQSYAARLQTFQTTHHLPKRRASSTQTSSKRKGGAAATSSVEWPHERPTGEELARAGFFYRPAQDSTDNVQCFLCAVKLDGWEAEDDALREHLAHSRECDWATSVHAGVSAQRALEDGDAGANGDGGDEEGIQDPLAPTLVAARKATFENTTAGGGSGWAHESKRGWKCKVGKMVEAGWCLDPASPPSAVDGEEAEEEESDGVTCFYCNLSLDGWEPKDDPMVEHRRRSPGCAFFALVERFGGAGQKKTTTTTSKGGRGGKKVGGARSSAVRRGSRLSTQSAVSTFSQELDLGEDLHGGEDGVAEFELELEQAEGAGMDDSITSTATTASQATTTGATKGKKKGGRPKAAAKGAKGRKRAGTVDDVVVVEADADSRPTYPDLASQMVSQPPAVVVEKAEKEGEEETIAPPSHQSVEVPASVPAPPKNARKRGRPSKQAQATAANSSLLETSSFDIPPPATKTTRGRKPKGTTTAEVEIEPEGENSDVSAQLQDELERSMSFDNLDMDMNMDARAEMESSTPKPEPVVPGKRGTKRMSNGVAKKQQRPQEEEEIQSDVGSVFVEFPVPPTSASAAAPAPLAKGKGKGKGGRKRSKQHQNQMQIPTESEIEVEAPSQAPDSSQLDTQQQTSETETGKPVKAKPGKTKKAPTATSKGKGKKGATSSSARSSRSSRATVTAEIEQTQHELEDLEQDEREIEAELQRIAALQRGGVGLVEGEWEKGGEFEGSPLRLQQLREMRQLEDEIEDEDGVEAGSRRGSGGEAGGVKVVDYGAASPPPSPPRLPSLLQHGLALELELENATPSPSGSSDKENQPSFIIATTTSTVKPPLSQQKQQQQRSNPPAPAPTTQSPVKITLIPLAPGTPNRPYPSSFLSPSKRQSPSKQPLSHLTSTHPWLPADIDALLLPSASPQPSTPSALLASKLADQLLGSQDRDLTVEQWIRARAARAEEVLRRRCEGLVGRFEREGGRGMGSLEGVGLGL